MEEYTHLVSAAQIGNDVAYETLMHQFQDMAYSTAYKHLGDHYLAQDAVQEALLEAFIHLGQLKEPAAFPGWFRQIVFRQCTRILRRASFDCVPLESSQLSCFQQGKLQEPNVEQVAVRREIQADVRQAIQTLPAHERQVTQLFYIAQYSQQELSVQLGLPVTTIKKRLYSARQRLKKQLHALVQQELAGIATVPSANEHSDAPAQAERMIAIVRRLTFCLQKGKKYPRQRRKFCLISYK